MKLIIETPIRAFIEEITESEMKVLIKSLTYTNTSAQHLLKRHYNNIWFRQKNLVGWTEKLEELKLAVKATLIFNESGRLYIRPGSIPHLTGLHIEAQNLVSYPVPKKVAWAKPLPFDLYPYQEQSVEKLIQERHGNVSLTTAAGKTAILLKICRETGFRTTIVAPSKSIFLELIEKFEHHFGRGKVGRFGAGKKVIGKQFTICINDSLVNLVPGSEEYEFFAKQECLLVDESHTFSSETLEQVCHGVFSAVPYRIFLSATQTRGDGTLELLQSIIGRTVHTLSTKEAMDGGYICPHEFRIVAVESTNPNFQSNDAIEMKRVHFLKNQNIAKFIARLANATANHLQQQTLVLVEELEQIAMLAPLLTVPYAIAHSETKKERLEVLGILKVDNKESVDSFNRNDVKVLIGTSAIGTGTNIFPTHNTCSWIGGSSEIRTKQSAVGRSVRLGSANPYRDRCQPKNKAVIWDFDVQDNLVMERHLGLRIGFYKESGSELKYIRIPNSG